MISLPKLEIPKLELPNINSALNKLTKTFDPSETVGQVSSNVLSQQLNIESVRSNLESIRQANQLAMANTDFNAVKEYTAGLAGQVDTACVMASVKPAFIPMTPDSLSNPLAPDVIGGFTGDLTGEVLSDTLIANTGNMVAVAEATGMVPEGMGPILDNVVSGNTSEIFTAENMTDLAVMGAGMYASSLTGGVIPPSTCSAVIEGVAGNAIKSSVASAMSGDPTAAVSIASSINTKIDTTTLTQSLMTDASGSMFEGTVTNAISKTVQTSTPSAFKNLSSETVTNIGVSLLNNLNVEGYTGNVGGINMTNPKPIINAISLQTLTEAATQGDTKLMLDHCGSLLSSPEIPAKLLRPMIEQASSNIVQTPKEKERYQQVLAMVQPTEEPVTKPTDTPYIPDDPVLDETLKGQRESLLSNSGLDIIETGYLASTSVASNNTRGVSDTTIIDGVSYVSTDVVDPINSTSSKERTTKLLWDPRISASDASVLGSSYLIVKDLSSSTKPYRYVKFDITEPISEPAEFKDFMFGVIRSNKAIDVATLKRQSSAVHRSFNWVNR